MATAVFLADQTNETKPPNSKSFNLLFYSSDFDEIWYWAKTGHESMTPINTLFLIAQVTSLDRIWSKVKPPWDTYRFLAILRLIHRF